MVVYFSGGRPEALKCAPDLHREASGNRQAGSFQKATPHRSPACTAEPRLGARASGLNWGTSGLYRAANPTYQNHSFSAKMRIASVLRGFSQIALFLR